MYNGGEFLWESLQRFAKACKGLQRFAKTCKDLLFTVYLPISLFEILKSKAIQKHRFWEIRIYITSIQCKQLFKNFLETWKFWFTRLKQRKEMQIISYYRKKIIFRSTFQPRIDDVEFSPQPLIDRQSMKIFLLINRFRARDEWCN